MNSVFAFSGGAAEDIVERITDNVATVIVDATDTIRHVVWFEVNQNSGGTPSITVEIYDGTTAHYLGAESVVWRAKAMTANQSVRFDAGYTIPLGSQLRITSNNAGGLVDVIGIALAANPPR